MADGFSDIAHRRAIFPAGLFQPIGSLRFGMDALLMASFAARILQKENLQRGDFCAAELGCGCGAALFALILQIGSGKALGIEREQELVEAAQGNARLLGLDNRIKFIAFDLMDSLEEKCGSAYIAQCDIVLANPPWHETRTGRSSPWPMRERALIGEPGVLAAFCARAHELLKPSGWFCAIIPPERILELYQICAKNDLAVRTVMAVSSFAGNKYSRYLVAAQKHGSAAGMCNWSNLVLHIKISGEVKWNHAAVAFCPWLQGGRGLKNHECL